MSMSPLRHVSIDHDLSEREDLREHVDAVDALAPSELDIPNADVRLRIGTSRFGREVLVLSVHLQHEGDSGEVETELDPDAFADEAEVRSKLRDLNESARYVRQWREALESLYQQVEQWLKQYPRESRILKTRTVNLHEERSRYEAPSRTIEFVREEEDEEEVYLGPIAMWVVGADGQADLSGPSDRFDLLLRGEKWYYAPRFPGEEDQELTEELFHKLLDQVLE
jgi:hypothetical protein